MKTKLFIEIALRIIVLFISVMLITFVTPTLHTFFGDIPQNASNYPHEIDSAWNWGQRHYWYFIMMILLFLLSLINTIVWIVKSINSYYP